MNITVIGAGTMGRSIALSVAWAQLDVCLYALNMQELQLAQQDIQHKVQILQEQQVLQESQATQILQHIQYVTDLETAVGNAHFIIEAVPENIEIKQQTYEKLEALIPTDTIVASNTSGIPSAQLIEKLAHPERFIITHFWNPAHLVPLVEIVPSKKTNDVTVQTTTQLLQRLNKEVVTIKKEVPGFIGNRLQFALLREAMALLDEGIASKEDIDLAVTHGIGRRLPITGPIMSADFTGLDVAQSICDYLYESLSNDRQTRPVLQQSVMNAHYGVKSEQGFYEWDAEKIQQISQQREQLLIQFLKQDMALLGGN